MSTLASLFVSIKADDRQARPVIAGVRRDLQDVDRTRVEPKITISKRVRDGLVSGLAASAKFAGVSAAGILSYSLAKGLSRLNAIDQAQAKLRGLGHSAQDVQGIMASALASVKGTAFGLDESATAAASAVAAGIQPGRELTKYLKLTADAATIAGTSFGDMGNIINGVTTRNKAYTADLNQLASRGIPIYQYLAKEYGVSANALTKMVTHGQVDAAHFRKAIADNIGGAALSAGNTTQGAFKNLQASLGRVGANLLSGVFPMLRGAFVGLTHDLAPVEDKAKLVGQALGTFVGRAATYLGEKIPELAAKIRGSGVPGFLQAIRDRAVELFASLQSDKVGSLGASFRSLGGSLARLAPAFADFTKSLPSVAPIMQGIAATFRLIADHAGLVVKVMPLLIAAFTAYKVLQEANNVLGEHSLVGFGLRTAATLALAGSNFALARSQLASNTATATGVSVEGVLASIRSRGVVVTLAAVVAQKAAAAASKLFAAAQWLVNAAMDANPIGLVVLALAGLAAGLVYAYKHSVAFRDIIASVGRALKTAFAATVDAVKVAVGAVVAAWDSVATATTGAWTGIRDAVASAWKAIAGFFAGAANVVTAPVTKAWTAVRDVTTTILTSIGDVLKTILGGWLTVLKVEFLIVATVVYLAWDGIKKVTSAAFTYIRDHIIKPVWTSVSKVFTTVMGTIRAEFTKFWDGLKKVAQTAFLFYRDRIILPVWNSVTAMFTVAERTIRAAFTLWWDNVKTVASVAFNFIYRNIIVPVWARIQAVFTTAQAVLRGLWQSFWGALRTTATVVFNAVLGVVAAVWDRVRGVWTSAQSAVRQTWSNFWSAVKSVGGSAIDQVHAKITTVLQKIRDAFASARNSIRAVWDGVKGVVAGPINWVKDNVYNRPLVPVWNRVADLVNGPHLKAYAAGGIPTPFGVRPGYTPGRDTHAVLVGGGEAIMRPEWTRAAGADYVNRANRAARTGGLTGAREFISRHGLPGDEGFAGGGIVGWLQNTFGSAMGAVSGLAAKLKDFVIGGLRSAASAALAPIRAIIHSQLSGSGVKDTVGNLATKALDLIVSKVGAAGSQAGGGGGGPVGAGGFARALAFARSQVGKPYVWAAAGPYGYDCSGFMGALQNVIEGKYPYARRWSTMAFQGQQYAQGFTKNKRSPFMIGVTNAGVGHTAGTLNGVNVESSGGVGVHIGPGARGWNNPLFPMHYGLAAGGVAKPRFGNPPFDTLDPRGRRFDKGARSLFDLLYGTELATGGLVKGGRGGVMARIGEGSQDELVVPLPKNWRTTSDAKLDQLIALLRDRGAGPVELTFNTYNPVAEPQSQTTNKALQRVAALGLV